TQAEQYYREIEALFPNQVSAIVFDQQGPRLVLSENANVPTSPALFLKICGTKGCQRFITFSGQQIRINGELCDVLLARNGAIIVSGQELFWSSESPAENKTALRIEAKPLGSTS